MPLNEDIRGIIFCNKPRKFIPSFGKSQKAKAIKIVTITIIKILFNCLNLLWSEFSILSTASLVLVLSFVFKNGLKIHITNKIKIIKSIRRTIIICFPFLVTSVSVIKPTNFQKHILPLPNNQLEKSIVALNPPHLYFLIRVQYF